MVLYVVTVSYVAFCSLILGWLLAIKGSTVEALVEMGGTYGTLLTGVPVLIAVLVAGQQLAFSRRQHIANIKRSFQPELDALDEVHLFAEIAVNSDLETAKRRAEADGIDGMIIDRPAGSELKKYREILPFDIADIVVRISRRLVSCLRSRKGSARQNILALRIIEIRTKAGTLSAYIQHRRNHLSQYWS
ncbi:hypothetical protein DEA98_22310 [Brucella pseudogrignonensis]|nr:hypothetical protein [Brucella pseudogrignonensis]